MVFESDSFSKKDIESEHEMNNYLEAAQEAAEKGELKPRGVGGTIELAQEITSGFGAARDFIQAYKMFKNGEIELEEFDEEKKKCQEKIAEGLLAAYKLQMLKEKTRADALDDGGLKEQGTANFVISVSDFLLKELLPEEFRELLQADRELAKQHSTAVTMGAISIIQNNGDEKLGKVTKVLKQESGINLIDEAEELSELA